MRRAVGTRGPEMDRHEHDAERDRQTRSRQPDAEDDEHGDILRYPVRRQRGEHVRPGDQHAARRQRNARDDRRVRVGLLGCERSEPRRPRAGEQPEREPGNQPDHQAHRCRHQPDRRLGQALESRRRRRLEQPRQPRGAPTTIAASTNRRNARHEHQHPRDRHRNHPRAPLARRGRQRSGDERRATADRAPVPRCSPPPSSAPARGRAREESPRGRRSRQAAAARTAGSGRRSSRCRRRGSESASRLRRSRKIQRRLRSDRLTMVSAHKASRRGQKVHGGLGNDPTRPNSTSVARRPTMRTAAAEARSSTHTIARGGCAARDGVSACATAIGSGAMVFPRRDERRRAFPNLPDHVRRLVLRLVIGPRLHFGQQARA